MENKEGLNEKNKESNMNEKNKERKMNENNKNMDEKKKQDD